MKLAVLTLLIIFSALSAQAASVNQRRKQILSVVNEEIKETGRLSSQYRHKNPRLLLRIAELYLEKARLLRDSENTDYLKIDPKKRSRVNRKKYFSGSSEYFIKAQNVCQKIIKGFRNFKYKADVYYILAYNYKEFGNNKKSLRYFKLSLKYARKGTDVYKKANIALAELYYNKKDFSKAIPLYKNSMKGKKDKWWTKDAFNLAWSMYRKRKFSRSLSLMLDVYKKSKSSSFVDMRKQVERDIGLVYIAAGKFNQALAFYRELGSDITPHLIKLGKTLIDKGKPAQAEMALVEARKHAKGGDAIDINLTLLSLFQKFGKYDKHLETARITFDVLREERVDKAQVDVFLFQLEKVGGILQQQVLKKSYIQNKKLHRKKARQAADYFELLSRAKPKQKQKYLYLRGETFYAAGFMEDAIKAYELSYIESRETRNKKGMKLGVEGMLAALGSRGLSTAVKEKYYIPTYTKYLAINSSSKGASKVNQKLFQVYFDKKDIANSEKVLKQYQKRFPRDLGTQEAMVAKIMEHYRKTGNSEEFNNWTRRIKSGEFKVSKKYGASLNKLLLAMQFENVNKASKSGDKKKALEGYIAIYKDERSSAEAKRNAAHNIAVLYFELGFADKTYEWANKAIDIFPLRKLLKFNKTYLAISSELFNMQRFEKSAALSEKILQRICKTKARNKNQYFKNAYIVDLAIGKVKKASDILGIGKKCRISKSVVNDAYIDVLEVLGEKKNWQAYESYLNKISKIRVLRGRLIYPLSKLLEVNQKLNSSKEVTAIKKRMESYYRQTLKSRRSLPIEARHEIAKNRLETMKSTVLHLNSVNLQFPEKIYNAKLQSKLKMLERITSDAERVFSVKSGKGSLKAYQFVIESYQRVVKEIQDFIPSGKTRDYVNGFKKSMKQVENALLSKSKEYLKNARFLISSGKVFSPDSYWFSSQYRLPVNIEYHFDGNGILMDKRGRR